MPRLAATADPIDAAGRAFLDAPSVETALPYVRATYEALRADWIGHVAASYVVCQVYERVRVRRDPLMAELIRLDSLVSTLQFEAIRTVKRRKT